MNRNIITLDELIIERYGERGTPRREKFERGYRRFKAEHLREMKSYKGKYVLLPGEIERCTPSSVRYARNRISLLVRVSRRDRGVSASNLDESRK